MIQQDTYIPQCDNFGIISNHWSHLIFMPHQDRLSIINIFLPIKRNTWNSTFWSTILSNSFWSKNECLPKLKTGWNIAVLELLQTILTLLIGLIRLIWINVKLPKRKWCSYKVGTASLLMHYLLLHKCCTSCNIRRTDLETVHAYLNFLPFSINM